MYLYIHCGGILSRIPNGHDANGHGLNFHNANMNHRRTLQHFKIDSKTTSSAFFKSRTSKQVIILYIKTQSKGLALNIVTSGNKLFIYKTNGK